MRVPCRGGAAALLALVLTGLARAQTAPPVQPLAVPPPPPVFPRLAAAVSRPHLPTAVPPGLEIEVLDPNVDPRGNPAVVTRPAVALTSTGPDGRVIVDIPPTVLVHRYYYTGDRTSQARLLPGGPCIVVVSHPKTGERLYIPVQFPPGAPRVTLTGFAFWGGVGTSRKKTKAARRAEAEAAREQRRLAREERRLAREERRKRLE